LELKQISSVTRTIANERLFGDKSVNEAFRININEYVPEKPASPARYQIYGLSVSSGAHLLIETHVIIWYGAGLFKIERSGIVTLIWERGRKGLKENKVYREEDREVNKKERNGAMKQMTLTGNCRGSSRSTFHVLWRPGASA
jgi:hypothetical protein